MADATDCAHDTYRVICSGCGEIDPFPAIREAEIRAQERRKCGQTHADLANSCHAIGLKTGRRDGYQRGRRQGVLWALGAVAGLGLVAWTMAWRWGR